MNGHIPEREKLRKTIHLIFGTIILLMIIYLGIPTSRLIIALGLLIGVIASLAIMRGYKLPLLQKMVEAAERENEKHFPGRAAVFFFLSALILLTLFQNNPTLIIAAISVQVFADSAAALIGIKYGKHKLLGKKSWEGSTACFIVGAICINFFYTLPIAMIAALAATIIEAIPLDDNLLVPLATGITLRLLI
jgi:dolichol kinase